MKNILLFMALITTAATAQESISPDSTFEMRLGVSISKGEQKLTNDWEYSGTKTTTYKSSTTGFNIKLGVSDETTSNYSYYYLGLEQGNVATKETWGLADFNQGFIGSEWGNGNEKYKFIYGGELGFGSLRYSDTQGDSLLTALAFIGARLNMTKNISITPKVNIGGSYYLEQEMDFNGENLISTAYSVSLGAAVELSYKF